MADNVVIPASGTGDVTPKVATEQVAATAEHKQIVELGVPGTGRTLIPGSVANGLLADVSRVAGVVSVNDNAGSLTVDAPVGTPVWVRLSDGAAAFVGQKAMAASVPVVVASDQSVIPVSDNAGTLTVDAPVGTPVFARLSDGAAALIGQKAMAASLPVAIASDQGVLPAVAEQRAATLFVTGTAAVNTGVTVTLPAVAGAFHYITSIQVVKLYSVIGVAAGAGVLITTTNLPGGPVWTTEQLASPAGTAVKVVDYQPTTPLKSSVVNTATTIVCPVQLQTIWRVNVSYFTAA